MIDSYEERKTAEEMRKFMGGNITIPDGVSPFSISRRRIKRTITRKEPKKKDRISVVASIGRIIGNLLRK